MKPALRYGAFTALALLAGLLLAPWMKRNLEEAKRLEQQSQEATPAPGGRFGSVDTELEDARKATEADPRSADSRLRYAALLGQRRRYKEALPELVEAARLAPDRAEPHLALSEVYQVGNLFDMALAHARKALALEPNNPRALHRVGQLYVLLDWPYLGMTLLKDAIAKHPTDTALRMVLAQALYQTQDYAGARNTLLEVRKLDPKAPGVDAPMMDIYLQLQQPAEAEKVARAALADDAKNPLYLTKLAAAQREQGNFPGAIESARAALAAAPESLDARFELAQSLSLSGDDASAQAELEKIIQKNLLHPRAAFTLGGIYARRGRPDDAKRLQKDYDRSLAASEPLARWSLRVQSHPDDAEAHRERGILLAAGKEWARAIVELKESLRLKPGDRRALGPLADALMAMERPQEAEAARRGDARTPGLER